LRETQKHLRGVTWNSVRTLRRPEGEVSCSWIHGAHLDLI
jgi:hypothetical protein